MTVVSSNYERKANDLYETEPWATEALLRHLPMVRGTIVWEPAAGNHAIANVLNRNGLVCLTSDVETYDRDHDALWDFFHPLTPAPEPGLRAIITNPPYGKGNREAVRFAELALERCGGIVALLLTAKFDFGKTRRHLFADNPRYWAKITLTDRICWFPDGKYDTGTEDHAWYVWNEGPNEFPRIIYEGRR